MRSIWEKIFDDNSWTTWRMKVPGGWMVLNSTDTSQGCSESLSFLPDPSYKWIKWEIEPKEILESSENIH